MRSLKNTTELYRNNRLFGCISIRFPSNREIATPVCALTRNDTNIHCTHQEDNYV